MEKLIMFFVIGLVLSLGFQTCNVLFGQDLSLTEAIVKSMVK